MSKIKSFLLATWASLIACCSANPCHAADTNVSVDVGGNVTKLLGQIAAQIGTTTDKVFPWYVKQQVLEGCSFAAWFLLTLAVAVSLLCAGSRKACWGRGNRYTVITIVGWFLCMCLLISLAAEGTKSATQILNPNYHAMNAITRDLSILLHK